MSKKPAPKKPEPKIRKDDPRYEAKLKEEVSQHNPEFVAWLNSRGKRKKKDD